MKLRIGTRGSKLALVQSGWIKDRIETRYPGLVVSLVQIKTRGDKILDSPLSNIGGKGLFVKEIEEALLRQEVDLAVHSMKDMPADMPEGLDLFVFPEREDPGDAMVSMDRRPLMELPGGSAIGTGSLRRTAQLLHMRSDLRIVPMRGNVDTRLRKLEEGNLHAIVLAAAGLKRLGFSDRISHILPHNELLPAIGQGSLGLEQRQDDDRVRDILAFLNHEETEVTVRAERAFLKTLGGGCQVPVAGHGRLEGENLTLDGLVAEPDGSTLIRDQASGSMGRPEEIGISLAEKLLSSGADSILARIYGKGHA